MMRKNKENEHRIFRYSVLDAWCHLRRQVDVIEREDYGEVRCLKYKENSAWEEDRKEVASSITRLSKRNVDKIKYVICRYHDILLYEEYDEDEFPVVIDGVTNIFEFSLEKGFKNKIRISNAWAFQDGEDIAIIGEKPYKAEKVLKVYDEIRQILLENGIKKAYLELQ